jgi:predicted amidohydrolase
VVLAEMFSVGFSPRTDRIAESPEGPSTVFLSSAARTHGIWAVGSVCMRRPGLDLPQNVAILVAPDGSVHRYAKRHLFSYAGEHERVSGGGPTMTVDVDGLRTTVFVCYDLRFADDFWRLAPDTDAYVVVANWPEARRHHWRSLLVARAIENQAWVVAANRVGIGGNLSYSGDSLVIDPMGEVVADGAGGAETILPAVLDPERVAEVRERYPFLADRGVPVPWAPDEH